MNRLENAIEAASGEKTEELAREWLKWPEHKIARSRRCDTEEALGKHLEIQVTQHIVTPRPMAPMPQPKQLQMLARKSVTTYHPVNIIPCHHFDESARSSSFHVANVKRSLTLKQHEIAQHSETVLFQICNQCLLVVQACADVVDRST